MRLTQLNITNVRNLQQLTFTCAPRYNIICGTNGSGKTSLLEAIYLLVLGRSFRSHVKTRVIHYQADYLSVSGYLETVDGLQLSVGIQKFTTGQTQLQLNQQRINTIAEIAALLPIQLINAHSYDLLGSLSKHRRQFMDWGVFHVKQPFYRLWVKTERILKQRNAALKKQATLAEITSWDNELSTLAQQIHTLRAAYIEQLLPIVHEFSLLFSNLPLVTIGYVPGWDPTCPLAEQLHHWLSQDLCQGYTHIGPQRATLQITVANQPVQECLSRGQQKVLILILRLAQAELLERQQNKSCLYLIDDFVAELDAHYQQQVMALMQQRSGQFFITGIDSMPLQPLTTPVVSQTVLLEQGALKVP